MLKTFSFTCLDIFDGNLFNSTQLSLKVLNAFIHAVIGKLQEETERKLHLVESFQMNVMWQG